MEVRLQEAPGVLGVAVATGGDVGDDEGGGVLKGVAVEFGMGTTDPTGPGDGIGPTGGLGLAVGTST